MALNSSGPISLIGSTTGQSIAKELGLSETAQLSLFDSSVRNLLNVASGPISMFDGYGKSSAFAFTISTNQQEANLRTLALAAGWNGTSSVTATVSAGVYIWSDTTGTAALTINGSWPGGVTLVNNGYIIGKGGVGGAGTTESSGPGGTGGPAISLGINATITNNSGAYIAGGGGGGAARGGGGGGDGAGGGGGAGGGVGGSNYTAAGGTAGSIGASGGNGNDLNLDGFFSGSGGGGGRILPGTGGIGGTVFSPNCGGRGGGAGGGGGSDFAYYSTQQTGGTGGSAGNVGGNGNPGPNPYVVRDPGAAGGGGGWGASGGFALSFGSTSAGTPGAGGKAIALNGFTATRSGAGTTYGAVS